MGKYDLDYSEFEELEKEFAVMTDELVAQMKATAQGIGKELKANTESSIPREAVAKHGTHLADDVKLTVSSNKKKTLITVKGGKQTGRLWWNVDSGHFATNGRWVAPVHFTDAAYKMTDVEGPIDAMLSKVVKKSE